MAAIVFLKSSDTEIGEPLGLWRMAGENATPLTLAERWENDAAIRAASRQDAALTTWPTPETIGHASQKALVLNIQVVEHAARWWVAQRNLAQTIPINDLRDQVGEGENMFPNLATA